MLEYPLFGIVLTLVVWVGATRIRKWTGTPLLDPVLLSVAAIIGVLLLLDIPYASYDAGGRVISFFLGPAVVALAVPFYRQLQQVRQYLPAIAISVSVGAVVGILSASGAVYLLGGSMESVLSVAPKSVTTPIAMELSSILEGTPPLTIAIVVLTGILGGMAGPELLRLVGVKGDIAQGIAIGTASHGIGTARALRDGDQKGAMSGVGMTLNGLLTTMILAVVAWLFV